MNLNRRLAFLGVLALLATSCGKWDPRSPAASPGADTDSEELRITCDAKPGEMILNHFELPGAPGTYRKVLYYKPPADGRFFMSSSGYAMGQGCGASKGNVSVATDFKVWDSAEQAFSLEPVSEPYLGPTPPPWHAFRLRAVDRLQVIFTVTNTLSCRTIEIDFLPTFQTKTPTGR